tara:strand:+ start:419 stop:667 length:249 start_codon:yes stop_codon:yes gene_type:complete
MQTYTILRAPIQRKSGTYNFTNLGDVRARNKSEAIKKMIQKKGVIPRQSYQFVAVSLADVKFYPQHNIEGIVKTGKDVKKKR